MVSHLQITAAHSAERRCTRKIKIKSRRDQATIKVGYTNSRGRQTMSQEGLHPQAVLPVGSSGLLNYWGFKWVSNMVKQRSSDMTLARSAHFVDFVLVIFSYLLLGIFLLD